MWKFVSKDICTLRFVINFDHYSEGWGIQFPKPLQEQSCWGSADSESKHSAACPPGGVQVIVNIEFRWIVHPLYYCAMFCGTGLVLPLLTWISSHPIGKTRKKGSNSTLTPTTSMISGSRIKTNLLRRKRKRWELHYYYNIDKRDSWHCFVYRVIRNVARGKRASLENKWRKWQRRNSLVLTRSSSVRRQPVSSRYPVEDIRLIHNLLAHLQHFHLNMPLPTAMCTVSRVVLSTKRNM